MKKSDWQKLINEIMDNFDFEKVHQCMVALYWQWYVPAPHIPTLDELKQRARSLMQECVAAKRHNGMGIGGFEVDVNRIYGEITLSFVVEQWDAYKEDKNG